MLRRCAAVAIGTLVLLLVTGGTAIAGVAAIPEIDPGSMASAVALLVAGGVLVAERMRRKFNAS